MEHFISFILAFGGWMVSGITRGAQRGGDRRIVPRVNDEFLQLQVASADPALCFDGRTAQIIDEREHCMGDNSADYKLVSVERYARNAHGEYFFFLSEGNGRPFLKHVPHSSAKAVLKRKYIAPG